MKSLTLLSRVLPIIIFCAAPTCPARAGDDYIIDHDQTHITFNVSNLGVSDITGVFAAYDGDLVFNAKHPEKDRVSITLYTGDIHATSGEADDDLQGPNFFNAQQFPQIEFQSTKIDVIDGGDARGTGDLTLLGVTKPVTFNVQMMPNDLTAEPSRDGARGLRFRASMTIERSDFGMDYLSPIIIGEEVYVDIDAYGVATENGRPPAR